MITLEQVKLLEAKVVRAIEYVERISRENSQLQGKLDSYQKRIADLDIVIQRFKEDQGRIEEGILSALDRLNRFEDIIEKSITPPAPEQESRRAGRKDGGSGGQKKEVPVSNPAPAEQKAESPGAGAKPEPGSGEDAEQVPLGDESSRDDGSGELDIF
ncbi:MAG: cell division protein ZapB [Treponema sp.]|jgi:hypothetical protein|nr:cell division protein ZapB [Treponema sp.]